MGHGHVTPNPNGTKARCGGPAICSVCALELANQLKQEDYVIRAPDGTRHNSWDIGQMIENQAKRKK